jgi:chromosome condensin MukBEF ATPase and DNA-binding subunit MukB
MTHQICHCQSALDRCYEEIESDKVLLQGAIDTLSVTDEQHNITYRLKLFEDAERYLSAYGASLKRLRKIMSLQEECQADPNLMCPNSEYPDE